MADLTAALARTFRDGTHQHGASGRDARQDRAAAKRSGAGAKGPESTADAVREAMAAWREAGDDDHFYGAWKGGAKSAGGRPMTKAEQAAAKGDESKPAGRPDEPERRPPIGLGVPRPEGPMSEAEALKRILKAMPGTRVEGLQWMDASIRGEVVPMLERLAASVPREAHPVWLKVAGARSGDPLVRAAFAGRAMGATAGGAAIYLNRADFSNPARMRAKMKNAEERNWFAQGTGMTGAQYVVAHEWGHAMWRSVGSKAGDMPAIPAVSGYAKRSFTEAWAEAFALWVSGGSKEGERYASGIQSGAWVQNIMAARWPDRFRALPGNRSVPVREADDDHFYGAWKGGSKAQGGHPMTPAERREAKANPALRRPTPPVPQSRMEALDAYVRDAQDALSAERVRIPKPEGPMSVQEAERRLREAMPRTRLEGLDRMSAEVRGEVVPAFEALAASYPDCHPKAIVVGSTRNNYITRTTGPGTHASTDMEEKVIVLHERAFTGAGVRRTRALLDYSERSGWLIGSAGGRVTQHQGLVIHEWGHLVDARLLWGDGYRRLTSDVPSAYGTYHKYERFPEAFVLHALGSLAPVRHEAAAAIRSAREAWLARWVQKRSEAIAAGG